MGHQKFFLEQEVELMRRQKYKLLFLPLFEEDLDEIIDYVANHLQNPNAAL